jgi:uncharacterized iron-regulated membrane protein
MASPSPGRRLRAAIVRVHRWLSLAAMAFWLVQAVTGTLIVFHWEMDDALAPGRHAATDLGAIERRLAVLAPTGSGRHVVSLWTSAGFPDRYDVTVDDATGAESVARIAGDGTVLRVRTNGALGLMDTIVTLHQTLLSGDIGGWIVGTSGLLLVTNLLAGLVAAWPRRGTWRRVLTPPGRGPPAARHYGWHRALGLIGVVPALLLAGAGTTLVFEGGIRAAIGGEEPTLPARPGPVRIAFAQAVTIAERAVPGSRLSGMTMPGKDDSTYRLRLRAPGEWARAYGTSLVFVDGTSGAVRGLFPAARAPLPRAAMEFLFPFHTGEAGGLPGRLLVLSIGLWLTSMILIGLRLWWLRRAGRAGRRR